MKKILFITLALIIYNSRLSAQCSIELLTIPPKPDRDIQNVCINTNIDSIYYRILPDNNGNFDKSHLFVTNLPDGVDTLIKTDTLIIHGTPSQAGTFYYSVTYKKNNNSNCNNNNCCIVTGQLTVNTNTVSSASGTPTVCVGKPLSDITHSTTGVTGISQVSVAYGLPIGVSPTWDEGTKTIIIRGTPDTVGIFNYSIPLTGVCPNVSVNATGTITVQANGIINLTSATGTDNDTICVGKPITPIVYTVGGTATGAYISSGTLPAGVIGTWNETTSTFTISGTPTTAGTYNFTIKITGSPCDNSTKSGSITVQANGIINLSSATSTLNQTVCGGSRIDTITFIIGGTASGAYISGPPWLSGTFNNNIFTITGIPPSTTTAGTYNFTVQTTGSPCDTPSRSGTITVRPSGTINLVSSAGTNNQTKCINTAINNITYSTTGFTGATVTGLPWGVYNFWENETLTIIGSPDTAGIFNYIVTPTGGCGNITETGTITVNSDYTYTLISRPGTDAQTVCNNAEIDTIKYSISGANNAIPDGLRGGLSHSYNNDTFKIYGRPSTSGTFNYTITLSGGCGNEIINGTITVKAVPIAVSNIQSQTICSGSRIDSIKFSSDIVGTEFKWTKVNSATTGIGSNGVGDSIVGTITNMTNLPITDTFRITPEYTYPGVPTCVGDTIEAIVVVNPIPVATITDGSSQTICSEQPINAIVLTSNVTTPTIVFNWRRNNPTSLTGISPSGTTNDIINGTLKNNTTLPIRDTFNIVPAFTYNNVTCMGDTTHASVLVNPLPKSPSFISLSGIPNTRGLSLCKGSTNINFNVSPSDPNINSYLWSSNPQNVIIRDTDDANTVISFKESSLNDTIRLEATDRNGCKNSAEQIVKVSSNEGFKKRKIFLKQPGNILIYPDNSMNKLNGYQWGYDSSLNLTTRDKFSAPIPIAGQVYQSFIPDSRFINNGQLDTATRAFWVLLQKDSCNSRVYYNGPYAGLRISSSPAEINTVHLKLFPNPNNGVFDIALTGNIYGNMHAVIYNTLGQVLFRHDFTKRVPELYERFNAGNLPAGLYFLEIKSSDLKKVQTRFIIKH